MKNILFIDDDYKRASSHIEFLKFGGYGVKAISAAHEALKEFENNKDKYDIIILDIMLPPSDSMTREETEFGRHTGLILLKKIREISKRIPIIILTVSNDIKIQEKAIELGADEYLLKPKLPSELIRIIEKYNSYQRI